MPPQDGSTHTVLRIAEMRFSAPEVCVLGLALAAAFLCALNLWRIGRSEDRQKRLLNALLRASWLPPGASLSGRPPWYQELGNLIAARLIGKAEQTRLLDALAAAGIKGHGHLAALVAARLCSAIAFVPFCWLLLEWRHFFVAAPVIRFMLLTGAAILGWRFPEVVLSRLAERRRRRLETGIPDALDLLVICAEAGLSLDHAIERVGRVLRTSNPEVAEEFAATAAEMRVSAARSDALENLAQRAGLPNLRSIISALNQSIRFGTPLAGALRMLAGEMRAESLARFEERAARLPVLLTVPLMAFILPALLLVIGSPLALRIVDMLGKRLVRGTALGRITSLDSTITRIWRDPGGASAMLVAIALPVLIGFGALGAEAGVWFTFKLRNQSAADSAAIAAAYQVIAGRTDIAADLTPAANEAAARNGYAGSTPVVIYPYADTIVSNGVAVTLEQSQRALLASMFLTHVTVATRAVAVIQTLDHACILALGTGSAGVAIGDGAMVDMPSCSIAANSRSANAIAVDGNTSSITAATLIAAGEISLQGSPINPDAPPAEFSLDTRPIIGAPDISDPYARTLTHAFLIADMPGGATHLDSWRNVSKTIYPGLYDKGMSFKSNAAIDLIPGVYYVTNGDFSVALGATVTCKTCSGVNGVTIVLTTITGPVGSVQISAGASITLQAPDAGTFSGILFVQDPLAVSGGSKTPDNRFEAGTSMKLTGLLYFPKTTLAFQGNPGAACTLTVADQVVISGASGFSAAGCTSAGLAVLPTVVTAALAE